jgi:phage tail sheath protein FI
MPEYLRPGVYIEEIERGPRPIEGVPTSTAAFLGAAERGSIQPRLVTSYREYERNFGGVFDPNAYLPYAVSGFFENGGKRLYVCRLVGPNATAASAAAGTDFSVSAVGPGAWGKQVWVKVTDSTTKNADKTPIGFRLRAAYFAAGITPHDVFPDPPAKPQQPLPLVTEDFDDLVTNESSPDFYGKRLNFVDLGKGPQNQGPNASALITLVRNAGAKPDSKPTIIGQLATNGDEDNNLDGNAYQGDPQGKRTDPQGLAALLLDPYRDIALVYAPGVADRDRLTPIIDHCENSRFRFAVIDCPNAQSDPGNVDPRVNLQRDTQYAAFYYPWISISDPSTGARKLVPPGGHVLGLYARTDAEVGVFKSPANDTLRGALDLEFAITDGQQDVLNPKGANAIRNFPGRGIVVWGARTMTANSLWKYISVRRLFIFLERSIYEGTQWVVFEPNDQRLWARVTDSIRLFLRTQWRAGALFGAREQDAFFVTCDQTTMTQDDILNGRLICEIGIAPVRPAEFVIFRIFQNTAEAQQ